MADLIRELRIRYHLYRGLWAQGRKARDHFNKMNQLIRERSPAIGKSKESRGIL